MALVSPVEAPVLISDAIRKASEATGTDFDYLLTTAARESNFKPNAKAKTSSAAGLFQFIESTWLQTVKEQGGRFGLEKYNPHIFQTESGRYYVPNREIRSEILGLRHNPEVSALMAGAFTQQNADYVGSRLGREPSQGELYIAHFLGANGATKLITLASKDPNARADAHFPQAAKANRSIFYSHRQARSVQQVYDQLVSDHSKLGAMTMAVSTPAQSRPAEAAPARPAETMAASSAPAAGIPEAGAADEILSRTLPARRTAAPMSRTRVAALSYSPMPAGDVTMTDAGIGGIGAWRTIVKHEASAASPEAHAAKTHPAPDRKPEAGTGPGNVPLRTRLHGGGARQAGPVNAEAQAASGASAQEPRMPLARKDFAARFWELQALQGG